MKDGHSGLKSLWGPLSLRIKLYFAPETNQERSSTTGRIFSLPALLFSLPLPIPNCQSLPSWRTNLPLFLLYRPTPGNCSGNRCPAPEVEEWPHRNEALTRREKGAVRIWENYEMCALVHDLLSFWVDTKRNFLENYSNWSLPPGVLNLLLAALQNKLTDQRLVGRGESPFIFGQ